MMGKTKKIIIVGGGISGLACTHKLKELISQHHVSAEVTLIEAQPRFGGMIESLQEDGMLYESGADIFLSEKTEIVDLCKRLGLREELISVRSKNRHAYSLYKKKLRQIPKGLYLIGTADPFSVFSLSAVSLPARFRILFEYFVKPKKDNRDESAASFIRRRFGEEVLNKIGQPMIRAIYSADPEKLSLNAVFPKFSEMEKTYGSLLKGFIALKNKQAVLQAAPRYHLFLSFRCGMETLTKALVRHLDGIELMPESTVEKISREESGWCIDLAGREPMHADAVCIAVPAYGAAGFLAGHDTGLSESLKQIHYESCATVNMVFEEDALTKHIGGAGFVIPKTEKRFITSVTLASNKFPYRTSFNSVLVRASVTGDQAFELEDQALIERAVEDVTDILRIDKRPVVTKLKRYARAMPQYEVGHLDKVSAIEAALEKSPGLFLTGNYLRGVAIPECVIAGEYNARKIFDFLYNNQTKVTPES